MVEAFRTDNGMIFQMTGKVQENVCEPILKLYEKQTKETAHRIIVSNKVACTSILFAQWIGSCEQKHFQK